MGAAGANRGTNLPNQPDLERKIFDYFSPIRPVFVL
jgi:hypothetical protein